MRGEPEPEAIPLPADVREALDMLGHYTGKDTRATPEWSSAEGAVRRTTFRALLQAEARGLRQPGTQMARELAARDLLAAAETLR